ncbi:MAG: VPLPA-CTERM sorting domain-containing protein [Pseudomonadota bacterium]
MRALPLALLLMALVAPVSPPVAASTVAATILDESLVAGGDFSDNFATPDQGIGVGLVIGTQKASSERDYFQLSALPIAGGTLDFTFTNPGANNGGGQVLVSLAPFLSDFPSGSDLIAREDFNARDGADDTVLVNFGPDVTDLYIQMNFTNGDFVNGDGIAYSVHVPVEELEVIPLPAGLPLVVGALAALAWVGRRRRA